MSGRRVLVTGAGGFIGRWSVPALRRRGFDVHAVLSPRTPRAVPAQLAGVNMHAADLLEATAIDALIATVQPTHLLHFAWVATPGIYRHSEANHRWLEAGRHLLRGFLAHGGMRAVMAGSCAEYSWSGAGVCVEGSSPLADAAPGIPDAYVACKIAMQRSLQCVSRPQGVSSAWGRIFFQYGPAEHPERLVPSVIRHLLSNRQAPCSHGRQIRSFLHAEDVGGAFAALLDSGLQGPVNIGSERRITVAQMVELIAAQIGRPDLVRLGARTAAVGEPELLVPDIHRLRDELGWTPRFSLEEGLADTIAWWRRELRGSSINPDANHRPGL